MLQVGIHDDDSPPPGMVEARGDRNLLPEVAAERDGLDPGIAGVLRPNGLERIVPGAVIDEKHLEGVRDALHHGDEAPAERLDAFCLAVDRNNDADLDFGAGVVHWVQAVCVRPHVHLAEHPDLR